MVTFTYRVHCQQVLRIKYWYAANLAWSSGMTYTFPNLHVDASTDTALSQNEVQTMWESFMGESGTTGANTNTITFSQPITFTIGGYTVTSLNFGLRHDTHQKAGADRYDLLWWADDLMAEYCAWPYQTWLTLQYYIENDYPGFINRYNNLSSQTYQLPSNEANYKIIFAKNVANEPGVFLPNIFRMVHYTFDSPNVPTYEIIIE